MSERHFSLAGRASLLTARELSLVAGQVLRAWNLPERRVQGLELAVAEMATNVCRHGYAGGSGPIRLDLTWDHAGLRVALADEGRAFDPAAHAVPDAPLAGDPATWPEGGLGLLLIRAAGDGLDYESGAQGNVLSLHVKEPLA
jgi:anti-sigma regulatory factor (Ser/Thr protein kinase)